MFVIVWSCDTLSKDVDCYVRRYHIVGWMGLEMPYSGYLKEL